MSPTSSISSWNNSSLWLLSWCCLTLRVALALLCRTAYHPDEYYQHSEVAYSIAFPNKVNNSDMMSSTWTWEWHEAYRIRSFVGLLPVVLAYKSAHVLSVPVQYWHYLPRLLQAILNTIGDVHFYQLARLCFDSKYAKIALFVHLTSWSSLYMTTRTLSNGTEAQLFIIAVYYLFTRNQRLWMTQQPYRSGHLFHLHIALCLMVISFWIRPTIVLIWVSVVVFASSELRLV